MQGLSTCCIVHDPGILGSARVCDIMLFFAQRLSATRPVTILSINSSFNNTYKRKIDHICREQHMAFVDLVVENKFDIQ